MARSAPSSRHRAVFASEPAVAITVAPAALPSWIAALPTPPAPARTRAPPPGRERGATAQAEPPGLVVDEEGGRLREGHGVGDPQRASRLGMRQLGVAAPRHAAPAAL